MKTDTNDDTKSTTECEGSDVVPCSMVYQSVKLTVDEQLMMNISDNLRDGLEYMQESLIDHDNALGRTTRRNKGVALLIESDIRKIKSSIESLDKQWPRLTTNNQHYIEKEQLYLKITTRLITLSSR